MTVELYQAPTLILLAAAVAVFAGLWLQGTSLAVHEEPAAGRPGARRRQLLWLAGWVLSVVRLALQMAGWNMPGWHLALSLCASVLAPLMFLASLAPQYVIRKPPVPFVAAFGLPIIVYCAVVGFNPAPGAMGQLLLMACVVTGTAVAVEWSLYEQLIPVWLSLIIVAVVGGGTGWLTMRQQYGEVVLLTHSGILLMTALLFLSAFRRLSTGLVFTVGGLLLWGLPGFVVLALHGHALQGFDGLVNLAKVVAAIGMILLVLEEEIGANVAARQRDRRTRVEMERYTAVYVAGIPMEDEGAAYNEVCRTIAEVSRFSQAAIFLRSADGRFALAGRAGMDGALAGALEAMARRTSVARARQLTTSSALTPVAGSLSSVDLTPLLEPGDELEQMNFRRCHVMVIRARDSQLQGVLLLAGLREPSAGVSMEDVLPLELLLARIGAAREQAALVRRLVQSERLAGLGQLAGGVAHELNNPLQAVTGFAELLADVEEPTTRTQATVILSEARRMKLIIDSLLLFRSASLMERMPVSVADLVADLPTLLQSDLEAARVQFEVKAPEELQRVRADAEQIRQVLVQVVKNAVGAFDRIPQQEDRRIRIEAEEHARSVHLVISHTGRPFAEPARAFDPFFKPRPSRDGERPRAEDDPQGAGQGSGQGLGLSICYAIVREHGGAISAVNLHPKGAAVVIELPIAVESESDQRPAFAGKGQAPAR